MSNMSDNDFVKSFSAMIVGMAAFSVGLFVLAQVVGDLAKPKKNENQERTEIAERIKPIGTVVYQANAVMDKIIPAANAAGANGQNVYNTSCMACHTTGAAGAPKLGDKAAWQSRIAKGAATLYDHAIKGFQGSTGVMPPKGGFAQLSDADVKAAVDYMVGASK